MTTRLVLLALPALFALGCGATEEQLRARAAFDFECSEGSVRIVEIDSRTRGASGCGKRATYVQECDGPKNNMMTECTWVQNSGGEKENPSKD